MHEINVTSKVRSIALFVGAGVCNAKCAHCAGLIHRPFAPKKDGVVDEWHVMQVLRSCHEKGARSLSLTSSGEPTLSPKAVTRLMNIVHALSQKSVGFSDIHLYTNGIRIGRDEKFAARFLPLWRRLGLTKLYVTVHNTDPALNAKVYGIKKYPDLGTIFSRIRRADLKIRVNLMLSRKTVHTLPQFVHTVCHLEALGVDAISAWPIRNADDTPDKKRGPSKKELDRMEAWINERDGKPCVMRLLREQSRVAYDEGEKLTLFPNGVLSNTWCK